MYCPNCGKESPDQAAFCGYCGTALLESGKERKPKKERPIPPQPSLSGKADTLPPETGPWGEAAPGTVRQPERAEPAVLRPNEAGVLAKGKPEKTNPGVGLKLFFLCCLLAAAAGGTMGFLTAQGAVDWRSVLPLEQLPWLPF